MQSKLDQYEDNQLVLKKAIDVLNNYIENNRIFDKNPHEHMISGSMGVKKSSPDNT